MNLSMYSAATGMEAQQLNLNTIANNLANVNTPGFKRSKIEFQDLIYQRTREAGSEAGAGNLVPTGVEVGNGSRVSSTSKVFTQGQLNATGEKLDIAIQGEGFFEVERPDGTIAYTRDGTFKLSAGGQVVTSSGYPVLSGFQAIPPGTTGIHVSENGEVTLTGADGQQNFRLNLTRFANPGGLSSIGGNLHVETPASGVPEVGNPTEDGFGSLAQGYVEMSNVNIVEEMVNLIIAQRAYEINSKSVQTSDEMMQNIAQMKR